MTRNRREKRVTNYRRRKISVLLLIECILLIEIGTGILRGNEGIAQGSTNNIHVSQLRQAENRVLIQNLEQEIKTEREDVSKGRMNKATLPDDKKKYVFGSMDGFVRFHSTGVTAYTPHDPIVITSNDDFLVQGFPGNGTASDPYRIENYNITNTTSDLITIQNTTALFVVQNNFLVGGGNESRVGILLSNVVNGSITSNTLTNITSDGTVLDDSTNNTVSGNTLTNTGGFGIVLYNSTNNMVSGNIITNTTLYGIYLASYSDNNMVSGNNLTITGTYGIYLGGSTTNTVSGNNLTNITEKGIFLYSSANNMVSRNTLTNITGTGILLGISTNNTVSGNTLTNMESYGIYLASSPNNTVSVNTLTNITMTGIYLSSSTNNTVRGNIIIESEFHGIRLWSSTNNTVSENTLTNMTETGIFLYNSTNNTMSENTLTNITGTGIRVFSSSNNTVSGNTFTNMGSYGMYLASSTNNTMSGNTFTKITGDGISVVGSSFSNHIWLNTFLAASAYDGTSTRANNTFEFNYWSLHENTDNEADGIADTPFYFPGGEDHYPVVSQIEWPSPPHLILSTRFLNPINSSAFDINVSISWKNSFDSLRHNVNHFLYYSPDGGSSWILLAPSLSNTSILWDSSLLMDGVTYKLKILANCSEGLFTEGIVDFIVDHSSPNIELFDIQNQTVLAASDPFFLNITDSTIVTGWYSWDGSPNQTLYALYEINVPLTEDYHWLFVYANDSVGHLTTQRFRFYVNLPPRIKLLNIQNDTILQPEALIEFTITDPNLDVVWFNWGNTENVSLTGPWQIMGPADEGRHWLTIYANDTDGHITCLSFTWTIPKMTNTLTTTPTSTITTTAATPTLTPTTQIPTVFLGQYAFIMIISFLVFLGLYRKRARKGL